MILIDSWELLTLVPDHQPNNLCINTWMNAYITKMIFASYLQLPYAK